MGHMYGYAVFHLNLAFSSVEENRRPEIIQKCYWPLLRLAADLGTPFGIEATGYTLREIAQLDPDWIQTFKHMVETGQLELIGSGFSQMIGPLVPNQVLEANLELGMREYEALLGLRPTLALINEQAFSAGLIPSYKRAGFTAIIMDWDACAANHPEWDKTWRFLPQRASNGAGAAIPVIWTHTLAFQKLQRVAHDDLELAEYRDYVASRRGDAARAFPIYGNDAEVFDFRPGRYGTEAVGSAISEWTRVRGAFMSFAEMPDTSFIAPSEVLDLKGERGADQELRLDSAQHPIPVKKQHKYNVSRWAVSGRDDLAINAACWRLYERLREETPAGMSNETANHWEDLCYLWSSDFRTHITEKRWNGFQAALAEADRSFPAATQPTHARRAAKGRTPNVNVTQVGRDLEIATEAVRVRLNTRKGLAVSGLWLGDLSGPAPIATLPHGYFDDIGFGADWYSGTTILEAAGQHKITDFQNVNPDIEGRDDVVLVSAEIQTPLGPITKTIEIGRRTPSLHWRLTINWPEWPRGSLRLGNFTLNPEAFEAGTLSFRAHNGGRDATAFPLFGQTVDHGAPVSFLVSANAGVGLTDGWMDIGDANRRYRIEVDMTKAALLGLVTHKTVDGRSFARVSLSASELDETRKSNDDNKIPSREFSFAIAS